MERWYVAQASGMVSVQAGCTPDHALALMTARAKECGSKVEDLAKAVVDRRLRFDDSPDE